MRSLDLVVSVAVVVVEVVDVVEIGVLSLRAATTKLERGMVLG